MSDGAVKVDNVVCNFYIGYKGELNHKELVKAIKLYLDEYQESKWSDYLDNAIDGEIIDFEFRIEGNYG